MLSSWEHMNWFLFYLIYIPKLHSYTNKDIAHYYLQSLSPIVFLPTFFCDSHKKNILQNKMQEHSYTDILSPPWLHSFWGVFREILSHFACHFQYVCTIYLLVELALLHWVCVARVIQQTCCRTNTVSFLPLKDSCTYSIMLMRLRWILALCKQIFSCAIWFSCAHKESTQVFGHHHQEPSCALYTGLSSLMSLLVVDYSHCIPCILSINTVHVVCPYIEQPLHIGPLSHLCWKLLSQLHWNCAFCLILQYQ